ncbi:MAG: hypothetical protein KAX39_08220, partial [candidate division Zixibacteria bacterium]|nr:hypothetical protein [candidate division Zixibacteria bacterium]
GSIPASGIRIKNSKRKIQIFAFNNMVGALLLLQMLSWMNFVKDIGEALQPIAIVIALILGGAWSYMLFIKNRQKFPRANITHKISHKPISNNKVLLNVAAEISNTGDVLLSLLAGTTRVQQVLPLLPEMLNTINEGKDPVSEETTEIEWPLIKEKEKNWKKREFEIEPGEKDQIMYDFIIDYDIETVVVYSHFKNVKKGSRNIGWELTTVYDLKGKQ